MDLYQIAKRLSRLIPEMSYTTLNQLFIYINTNKTFRQLMSNLPLESRIKFTFFLDAVLKGVERKSVEWSINNNLYTFDEICFGTSPGEINCDRCGGDGHDTCDECGGDGDIQCGYCDGTGEVDSDGDNEYEECDYCGGSGYESCDNCGGSGREDCYECEGEGKVDDDEKVPEMSLVTYISYDLNLEAEIEGFLSEMKETESGSIASNYPVLFVLERTLTSENISVSSIPEKVWSKCFINKIGDFKNESFTTKGEFSQFLITKENNVYDINEKLLN